METTQSNDLSFLSKIKKGINSLIYMIISMCAIAIVSVVGMTGLAYNVDCGAGDPSSVFELKNKFRLELMCDSPASTHSEKFTGT